MAAGLGANVWIPRDSSWARASVVSSDGMQLCVRREEDNVEVVLDSSQVYLYNNEDVEDMTALSFLHEPGVLWNLQTRYSRCDIYTYTGSILIAVNPFKPVPHLYGNNIIEAYLSTPREKLPPHVYATACAAFRSMMLDGAGQAILVTGESGAGKTETAKLIMACLTHLGTKHSTRRTAAGGAQSPGVSGVEQKILESNPLLEAFGNAKTLRNNNSSRFGKYVEIFFDPAEGGVITGAAVRTYLLERSRVVSVNNPERSFHIFYQLVYGASPADRAAWRLPDTASGFAYLARSSCVELPGQSNAEEYQHTRRAMAHIGLSEQQQSAVLATVAAVLHLGNITFVDSDGEAAAVAEGGALEAVKAAADLLGVEPGLLAEALTTRQIQTREGAIATPLSAQAAADARDSMAKAVYARLFDWLVSVVNTAVDEAHNGASGGSGSVEGTTGRRHLSIGLLDIYGFESFQVNDLEQLCINLTNEKLQQHFNEHIFKWEQAEYEREGVDWSYISFRDNADVLELLEGRMGLMDLLDELCRFPKASAEDLAHKYCSSQTVSANARFTRLNRPVTSFGVEHYAGSVTYSTQNFLEKNRDYIVADHQSLLGRSRRPLLQELFPPEPPSVVDSGGGGARGQSQFQFRSVSSLCRRQLTELMAALSQLRPHYVRCIKPNPVGAMGEFSASYSLHQLRCGGVMEAVRIACAGYSYRRPYASFLEHFWQLCPEAVHKLRRQLAEKTSRHHRRRAKGPEALAPDLTSLDDDVLKAAASAVLAASGLDSSHSAGIAPQYHKGHTKVFLRSTAATTLERQRLAITNAAATVIQAHVRRLQMQRWYHGVLRLVTRLQACYRGILARREAERRRVEHAATVFQRSWRGCVERLRYQRLRKAAVVMQAMWRGVMTWRAVEVIRLERAAIVIQTAWRNSFIRREYLFTLRYWRAAVRIQAAWRCHAARQLYLQILPLHRAAQVIQRIWRANRRGAQRAERLRMAFLQYWIYSRAAVVIQASWRGLVTRRLARRLRLQRRKARLLAVFGGPTCDHHQLPPRYSPDACRRMDVRTPQAGARNFSFTQGGAGSGGSSCKGYSATLVAGVNRSADNTPLCSRDVIRANDLALLPDRDSRVRARLAELQDFKVSPLVQYWQRQEAAAVDNVARRPYGRRRSTSGGTECPRPLVAGTTHESPSSLTASCNNMSSLPASPLDVGRAIAMVDLAKSNVTRRRGRGRPGPLPSNACVSGSSFPGTCTTADGETYNGSRDGSSNPAGIVEVVSGALSREQSYGQLLYGRQEFDANSSAAGDADDSLETV